MKSQKRPSPVFPDMEKVSLFEDADL